jgi:hypothetical protein
MFTLSRPFWILRDPEHSGCWLFGRSGFRLGTPQGPACHSFGAAAISVNPFGGTGAGIGTPRGAVVSPELLTWVLICTDAREESVTPFMGNRIARIRTISNLIWLNFYRVTVSCVHNSLFFVAKKGASTLCCGIQSPRLPVVSRFLLPTPIWQLPIAVHLSHQQKKFSG